MDRYAVRHALRMDHREGGKEDPGLMFELKTTQQSNPG